MKSTKRRFLAYTGGILSTLLLSGIVALTQTHRTSAQTITVGSSDKYSSKPILGWGVFPSYHHTSVWTAPGSNDYTFESKYRAGVKTALYSELGVNFMRVEMSWLYYDGSKTDLLAPGSGTTLCIDDLSEHIRYARFVQPGIGYMVSVWSPHKSLKDNGSESGGHLIGYADDWRDTDPLNCSNEEKKHVDFLVSGINYLKEKVGLPAAMCLQNEPTHTTGYASCVYSGDQFVRVTRLLRQKLDAKGFNSVTLLAAEGNDYRTNFNLLGWGMLPVANELNSSVGGLATHSYDTPYADSPAWFDNPQDGWNNGNYVTWDDSIATNPTKPVWMTEFATESFANLAGKSEIDRAINSARHLAREMVRFPTQYWFWWMGWNKNGGTEALVSGDTWDTAPNKTKTFHVLSKLWKSVPAGNSYVRKCTSVESDGSTSARIRDYPVVTPGTTLADWEVDTVAFRRSDNRTVLLIVNKNPAAISVTVKGLETTNGNGTMADVFKTTGSANNQVSTLTLKAGQGRVSLPQRSVTIIVVR